MENSSLIKLFFEDHQELKQLEAAVVKAVDTVISCYENGGKLLICGNGGSSADADHIVGELMKSFEKQRPLSSLQKKRLEEIPGEPGRLMSIHLGQAFPAISLTAHSALITAISNDMGSQYIFAQQLLGYGREGDILIALTTSGNSENILYGCMAAKAMGITTICFTGESGGRVKEYSDILIDIPAKETARIQELTIPLYHLLCRSVENHFFGDK